MLMKAKTRKKPAVKKQLSRPPAAVQARSEPDRSKEKSGDLDSILSEVALYDKGKRLEHWEQVECPYCGENFDVHIDSAEDGQSLYEDCHVCCKPISLHIQVDEDEVHVGVGRA